MLTLKEVLFEIFVLKLFNKARLISINKLMKIIEIS